jgi:hypothetical protein
MYGVSPDRHIRQVEISVDICCRPDQRITALNDHCCSGKRHHGFLVGYRTPDGLMKHLSLDLNLAEENTKYD